MASSRIQRWALTLAPYQYTISYKPGKKLSNADAFSRLPQPTTVSPEACRPGDVVHVINHLSSTTFHASNVREWTNRDPVLSKVKKYVLSGWPSSSSSLEEDFKPYRTRQNELSVEDGCVLWGSRVVIPPQGRKLVLEELHDTHPGSTKMKALARCYVWWPKMDSAIEDLVKKCHACQETRAMPTAAPLHPWEQTAQPWSRLHLDFAGPFCGHMFLVLVDSHSKWMDIQIMHSITSEKTIEKLGIIFATHGLPQKIVTDNGPSFTSKEFEDFMQRNGIKHVKSAPYHPSTNGLAERAVQSFKQALKRMSGGSIQVKLSNYLFKYRITPHATTGVPPAQLLMKRQLRSRLDLLYPSVSTRVEKNQLRQTQTHDSKNSVLRSFCVGDTVYAKNFASSSPKWLPGVVTQVTGPLSYEIALEQGTTVRRHVDSVRSRVSPDIEQSRVTHEETTEVQQAQDDIAMPAIQPTPPVVVRPPTPPPNPRPPRPVPLPRRSTRDIRPPNRLM